MRKIFLTFLLESDLSSLIFNISNCFWKDSIVHWDLYWPATVFWGRYVVADLYLVHVSSCTYLVSQFLALPVLSTFLIFWPGTLFWFIHRGTRHKGRNSAGNVNLVGPPGEYYFKFTPIYSAPENIYGLNTRSFIWSHPTPFLLSLLAPPPFKPNRAFEEETR